MHLVFRRGLGRRRGAVVDAGRSPDWGLGSVFAQAVKKARPRIGCAQLGRRRCWLGVIVLVSATNSPLHPVACLHNTYNLTRLLFKLPLHLLKGHILIIVTIVLPSRHSLQFHQKCHYSILIENANIIGNNRLWNVFRYVTWDYLRLSNSY